MENTYLYLARLQLLSLDLCPFNLGIHAGWLIDRLFDSLLCICFTCWYTHVLPPFDVQYPVQMLSLVYLIFVKKQRITFFDPPGRRVVQKMFHPDRIRFCKSLSPFFLSLSETGSCWDGLHRFIWTVWHVLKCRRYPANIYLICSKENTLLVQLRRLDTMMSLDSGILAKQLTLEEEGRHYPTWSIS